MCKQTRYSYGVPLELYQFHSPRFSLRGHAHTDTHTHTVQHNRIATALISLQQCSLYLWLLNCIQAGSGAATLYLHNFGGPIDALRVFWCTYKVCVFVTAIISLCVIVGFRSGWTKLFRLLGCYAAWGGLKPTFRDYLLVPPLKVNLSSLTL